MKPKKNESNVERMIRWSKEAQDFATKTMKELNYQISTEVAKDVKENITRAYLMGHAAGRKENGH